LTARKSHSGAKSKKLSRKKIENEEQLVKTLESLYSKTLYDGLKYFFKKVAKDDEKERFFNRTLPAMQKLVLKMPQLVPTPLPLLLDGVNKEITLSQEAVSCLVAGGFFSLYPVQRYEKHEHFPSLNFKEMFMPSMDGTYGTQQIGKLRCFLNYFDRVTTEVPTGQITFGRQTCKEYPDWSKSVKPIKNLTVDSKKVIEDAHGALQADFANKYIGGGTLERGAVQEEIRFAICPELMASMLFCEMMGPNDAIIMIGAEQFSNYRGYGQTLAFNGNYVETAERDEKNRRKIEVVGMDALDFRSVTMSQYSEAGVHRELSKAYVSFMSEQEHPSPIATGNWGCGVFKGDAPLKAIIQLLAASQANRDTLYFSFNREDVGEPLIEFHQFLVENKVTVGQLYNAVLKVDGYNNFYAKLKSNLKKLLEK
jgi:poly(ADP-ribose) glycohydrolase